MKVIIVLAVTVALAAACSSKPEETPPQRTKAEQRAVDSTIGASRLPGASGVRGALAASDSLAARTAAIDSMSKTP